MTQGIVIVDYGMGNLRSVQKAFEAGGVRPKISSHPRDVEKARKLVVPGVGAFRQAMQELKKLNLVKQIQEKIRQGVPYLGLCLGLQLLFSESEEGGRSKGMDVIPGTVRKFRVRLKVPHMGWNTVQVKKKECPLFKGIRPGDFFYFVHSYYGVSEDPSWNCGLTRYGLNFCSTVWKGNIFATQFHPEKSQAAGLRVIRNFIDYGSSPRSR